MNLSEKTIFLTQKKGFSNVNFLLIEEELMSASKVYAVVLFDAAAKELGQLISLWVKKSDIGFYLYAKKVDPSGHFFHMWLENISPDGRPVETELQIPHQFVKAIFYAADKKSLGFIGGE